MARVAFIGLGNMGGGMAANLAKAGHEVAAFDLSQPALDRAKDNGCSIATSAEAAVKNAEAVVTMLPAGKHVAEVYRATVLPNAPKSAILIDCSTIDVATAKAVEAEAAAAGFTMVDAPVSGGIAAADGGTLTFMVGGSDDGFARAKVLLDKMGKAVIHAGEAGAGQAAKICNNMLLGISMIGVAEAFVLAEKLELDFEKLFKISAASSGQCWSLTSYCPVPGPVPASPANREYAPGFATALMLKDLTLAQQAADGIGAATPLGAHAMRIYEAMAESGVADKDFSYVFRWLADRARAEVE